MRFSAPLSVVFVLLAIGTIEAQNPRAAQFIGTVTAFRPESTELEIKPDSTPAVAVKIVAGTVVQRIAPGEKDLKNAQRIEVMDVALGDRVLLTLEPNTNNLRRLIVMARSDIAKRDEADRMDWNARGISGVVTAKVGDQLTLKIRPEEGEAQAIVTVGESTTYKRYAPDSVKFADAKLSKLAEVQVGDQLRARGQKSADGSNVAAEDVVFGTFQTKAGTILSIEAATNALTVKELGTDKTFTVHLTADSQLKMMPDFAAVMGGRGGPPVAMTPPAGFAPPRGAGPDLTQMLDRMPAAKLDDLKPGQTIVVSSTKGTSSGSLTAIMLMANADMLIQMARSQSLGRGRTQASNGPAMNGMNGLGGFELPGMIP